MSWSVSASSLARMALLAAAMSVASTVDARATTIAFSWAGASGYSAAGNFTYDGSSAPAVLAESGAGATQSVQSFFISFFDPAHTVLESGSSVIGGVSSDRFFRLTFNTLTDVISALDADVGGSYIYFLSNLRTPTGSTVPPGGTGFNFFDRRMANAALDTAPGVSAFTVAVPEPSALVLMVTAVMSLLSFRRQRG